MSSIKITKLSTYSNTTTQNTNYTIKNSSIKHPKPLNLTNIYNSSFVVDRFFANQYSPFELTNDIKRGMDGVY
jgi:hypothetical protein